jgi:hypothetical protein
MGAVFGALAGAVAFTFSILITAPLVIPDLGFVIDGFLVGAIFGAPLGALTAPAIAWLLLRHIPLGRAFLGSAAGTVIGGVVGWMTTTSGDIALNSLVSAFIGCVVTAIALRYRAHRLEA